MKAIVENLLLELFRGRVVRNLGVQVKSETNITLTGAADIL